MEQKQISTQPLLHALDDLLGERAFKMNTTKSVLLGDAPDIDASHWYKIQRGQARLSPTKYKAVLRLISVTTAQRAMLDEKFQEYRTTAPLDGRTLKSECWISGKEAATDIVQELGEKLGGGRIDVQDQDFFDAYSTSFISDLANAGRHDEAIRNGSAYFTLLRESDQQVSQLLQATVLSQIGVNASVRNSTQLPKHIVSQLEKLANDNHLPFVSAVLAHNRFRFQELFDGEQGFWASLDSDEIMRSLLIAAPEKMGVSSQRYHGLYAMLLVRCLEPEEEETLTRTFASQRKHFEGGRRLGLEFEIARGMSKARRHLIEKELELAEESILEVLFKLERTQSYQWLRLRAQLMRGYIEVARLNTSNERPDTREAAISYFEIAKQTANQNAQVIMAQGATDTIARLEQDRQ